MEPSTFSLWLVAWLGGLGFVLWRQAREQSGAGLVIAYVLQLWLIHWLAAAIYALPWYGPYDQATATGLRESTYGMLGFAVGTSIVAPFLWRHRPLPVSSALHTEADSWLVRTYLVIGVLSFFVEPTLHSIPTVGAVAAAMANLLLVAVGMECWNALNNKTRSRHSMWRWIAIAGMLPFVTIITKGFIGYGFASMLAVLSFVASFYRPRWKLVASSMVVGYLALSLYVTYMRDRHDIRTVVWGQEAYSARLSQMADTIGSFEFLDIRNPDHLDRIDQRLNQNELLGLSMQFLEVHPDRFAAGRTLWEAAMSPIPRALWPDRPTAAGSGDLVSEFTGLRFIGETAVGIGHVMELYVNFATTGVWVGMMIMGVFIAWLDRMAFFRIQRGDWPAFVMFWLPGLGLLQVGGSLVDAISVASASLAAALIIQRFRPRRPRSAALGVPLATQ